MPEILGVADVHLVMLDPQFDEVLLPSKTAVALAAGRPILFLGNPASELARLVREEQVGVAVAQEDVEGIVAAIRHLATDRAQCTAMGQRARQLFDERFERGQAARRWLKLLARLESDDGAR
jgi:glycosyltransferase involved in cell wall biosynthesis